MPFSHLFATLYKYQFSLKFHLEFGQYMVGDTKVPLRYLQEIFGMLLHLLILQSNRRKHKNKFHGIKNPYVIGLKH
jgi:hypothetical protein